MPASNATKARQPNGLKTQGKALWQSVVKVYVLRPDEIRILERACRTMDRIDEMDRRLKAEGLTSVGSMGQDVAHPLLGEVRQHEATFARLMKQLDLPDEPGEMGPQAQQRAAAARSAAQARWQRGA